MNQIDPSFDNKTSEVTLSFRSATQASSAELLNEYILFIDKNIKQHQLENLLLFVGATKRS
ncbi:MAG: LPS O-antigen subunit length determinant protein (WzzB/FepE family) [Psychromonas sp.]|jgi:LPS O-antigen subunit length determinant protein (WzzB/FepE family)